MSQDIKTGLIQFQILREPDLPVPHMERLASRILSAFEDDEVRGELRSRYESVLDLTDQFVAFRYLKRLAGELRNG